MAVVDTREPNRNYPVPYVGQAEPFVPSNNLDDDVERIGQALAMIGIDVAALVQSVGLKAGIDHSHAMAAIVGLVDALAGKANAGHAHALNDLSDVNVSGATAYQVLAMIAGAWQPWVVDLAHVTGSGVLRVDQPQALSAGEKSQARTNIGAAPLDNPNFTTGGKVSTASTATDTLDIVNVTMLRAAIAAIVASSPAALDTLNELAAALGNDPNFASTVLAQLAAKASVSRQILAAGLATGGGSLEGDRTITVPKATAIDLCAGADDTKALTSRTVADAMAAAALAYAATVTIDHRDGPHRTITLTGNVTLAAPTNILPGMPLNLWITQDATGSRVITAWNAAFDFGDGAGPTLSTTASATDLVSFVANPAGTKLVHVGTKRRAD